MNKPVENIIKRDWREWQTYQAITPKIILGLFIMFVFLSWSAHNTEMDRAAVETGQAVLSAVGIGNSDVLDGVSNLVARPFLFNFQRVPN